MMMKFAAAVLLAVSSTAAMAGAPAIPPGPDYAARASVAKVKVSIPHVNLKTDCGAKMDGASDDTPAFNICASLIAASGAGTGVIDVPPGIVTANAVATPAWAGIVVQGAGWGKAANEAAPTSNYWQPFDQTKPVFQIGDDTGTTEGVTVRDAQFKVTAGQYGVGFGGGAVRNQYWHIKVYGASKVAINYSGGVNYPSVHDLVGGGSYARNFADGAELIRLYDQVNGATIFNNDHLISDFTGKAGPGGIGLHVIGSFAHIVNYKSDGRIGYNIIEQGGGTVPAGLDTSSSEFDSALSSDLLVVYKGYADESTTRFDAPFGAGLHVDGWGLNVQAQTTGTVASGSTSLSVASATGASAGKTVLVRAPSNAYWAKIVSVSGTTLTLDTQAPAAASGVEVDIGYRHDGAKGIYRQDTGLSGSSLQLRDFNHGSPALNGLSPSYTCWSGAAGAPTIYLKPGCGFENGWNTGNNVALPTYFLGELKFQATPDSVVRSGTTVTVSLATAGTGGASTSDFICIDGANEAGINGGQDGSLPCYQITGNSGTSLTYTSPVSGALTATGTIKATIWRRALQIDSRVIFPKSSGGFHYEDANGNPYQPFTCSNTYQCVLFPGSATLSTWQTLIGTSYAGTNTTVYNILQAGSPNASIFRVNGSGGVSLGGNPNPTTFPGLYLTDATVGYGTNIGTDGLFWVNGGIPQFQTGTTTSNVLLGNPSSVTVTGGTGVMGTTGSTAQRGELMPSTAAGATSWTVTFGTSFATTPFCQVASESGVATSFAFTATGLSGTTSASWPANGKLTWSCAR